MGLKHESAYQVTALNITVPQAYARITGINIDLDGNVKVIAQIQQTREDIGVIAPLKTEEYNFKYDKTGNPFELAYLGVKCVLGEGWEDDNPETPIV